MRQSGRRFADLKLLIGHTRAAERQRALPAATSAVNQSATVDHHELEELRDQALRLYIEAHERRQPGGAISAGRAVTELRSAWMRCWSV
jgi:hypothetical protein